MREKVGMTWAYRDLATFLAHAGEIDEAREALAKFIGVTADLDRSPGRDALGFIEPVLLVALPRGTEDRRPPGRVDGCVAPPPP